MKSLILRFPGKNETLLNCNHKFYSIGHN